MVLTVYIIVSIRFSLCHSQNEDLIYYRVSKKGNIILDVHTNNIILNHCLTVKNNLFMNTIWYSTLFSVLPTIHYKIDERFHQNPVIYCRYMTPNKNLQRTTRTPKIPHNTHLKSFLSPQIR